MDNIANEMNKYSSPTGNMANSSKDFLESNSLVAKMSFLLLVIFIFSIVLRLGITMLSWFLEPSDSPMIIKGMHDAKNLKIIEQDPSKSKSKPITRSVNESEGISFTWSIWLYIEDLTYKKGKMKHVFHKGADNDNNEDMITPIMCPGLFISPFTNSLIVYVNTFANIDNKIEIDNIPIRKWVNVIIRCENSTLDIYINGSITKSVLLQSPVKQNFGKIFIAKDGGFDGNISNFQYFNHSLNIREIHNIQKSGADNTLTGTTGGLNLLKPNYLSLRWYFMNDGTQNSYNP
jgi:hypothetical protein